MSEWYGRTDSPGTSPFVPFLVAKKIIPQFPTATDPQRTIFLAVARLASSELDDVDGF